MHKGTLNKISVTGKELNRFTNVISKMICCKGSSPRNGMGATGSMSNILDRNNSKSGLIKAVVQSPMKRYDGKQSSKNLHEV